MAWGLGMAKSINLKRLNWQAASSSLRFRVTFFGSLVIENAGDQPETLRAVIDGACPAHVRKVSFCVESRCAEGNVLHLVNEYNYIQGEVLPNSTAYIDVSDCAECALLIKIAPNSKLTVTKIEAPKASERERLDYLRARLKGEVAIVVPAYPSMANKYPCAFVHARVLAYQQAGIKCDVICSFDSYENLCSYLFEGVSVVRLPLSELADSLCLGGYQKVLAHFFDERYASIFEDDRLSDAHFFLWSHNPETRYWDWPLFTGRYFEQPSEITDEQRRLFSKRDETIRRFNERENVSWVFVSDALKARSEELIGIRFNRAHVIPNIVDEQMFPFREKDSELRKMVFIARKFENVSTYALDIDMQCIVELSKRQFFSELEFNVYGTGSFYDQLVEPVRHFPNVRLHKRFLSREEMARVHGEHGIALFATRFDSQGVAMGEAAMSGLAVVSSQIDAAQYFLPNDCGLLAEVENPVAYADVIERLYSDPDHFTDCARRCHEKVYALCRREETIGREIELIERT